MTALVFTFTVVMLAIPFGGLVGTMLARSSFTPVWVVVITVTVIGSVGTGLGFIAFWLLKVAP